MEEDIEVEVEPDPDAYDGDFGEDYYDDMYDKFKHHSVQKRQGRSVAYDDY